MSSAQLPKQSETALPVSLTTPIPSDALARDRAELHIPSQQQAVAIAYETGDYAPRVVASGRGAIAEQIILRAREHGVFVHESKELVALLMQVDLDDHIPAALYVAIAEILAWLYRLDQAQADAVRVSTEVT